jgi:hypothetical protein
MTMKSSLALLVLAAACGSSPDVRDARALAEAAVAAPPPYEGVTRCGPPTPPPTPTPSPSPSPSLGFTADADADGDVHGYLDKDLIARPIRARLPFLRACYEKLLAVDPDAGSGRVTARFQVLADGSVAGIEIEGWDPRLDRCVCDEVASLQYPKFGSARFGGVTVSYPFLFNVGASSPR